MSDDLEFHIQELDRKVESMFFKGDQNGSNAGSSSNGQTDILDRNTLVSREGGTRGDTENEENRVGGPYLKRGSTQATGATDLG
jgi:hypothetical protein